MMRARAVVALLLLLSGGRAAHGQRGLDSLVPPSPAPGGFIADGGPVLDSAALARINARIAEVQRATGGDVGVAILRDLRDRAPADVGVAIYRAWKIGRVDSLGSARRDLGALLLIVPKELAPSRRGECWITTGLGAEGELIDADAGAICRDSVIPHLRERDYAGAVAAGVEGIAAQFATATTGLAPPSEVGHSRRGRRGAPWLLPSLLGTLGAAGAAVGGLVYRRRRPRPCPHGHGPMTRLGESEDDVALDAGQRVEERVGSVDYDVWACPTCDARTVVAHKKWWSSYEGCPECRYRTLEKSTRTLRAATRTSTGLDEITLACAHCAWRDVTRRTTPKLPPPSAGGSGGGGGSRGGGGFGGSGRTAGGGGGGSY